MDVSLICKTYTPFIYLSKSVLKMQTTINKGADTGPLIALVNKEFVTENSSILADALTPSDKKV